MASGYINLPVTGGGGGSGITQLSGEVTAGPGTGNQNATVSNAAVIGKVLTGYASTTGAITAADTILSAIGKLNGNSAAISAAAVTSLTGEVTGTGPGATATTVSNAAVIAKVLTGFTSGAGTVSATDSVLAATQKLDGNTTALAASTTSGLALKVNKSGDVMTGNLVFDGASPPIAIGPQWTTSGVLRMAFTTVNGESGSNNGSDLRINRYDDSGTLLGPGITIVRANGLTTVPGAIQNGGGITTSLGVTGSTDITIDQANNAAQGFNYKVGGLQRWKVRLNAIETGAGNTGSNYVVERYADNGTVTGVVFSIARSDGTATFSNNLSVANLLLNGTTVHSLFGGSKWNTRALTTSTTMDSGSTDNIVLFNHTAAVTYTLINSAVGRRITVKDITGQANNFPITITPNAGATIDKQTSFVLNQPFGSVELVQFSSTAWYII